MTRNNLPIEYVGLLNKTGDAKCNACGKEFQYDVDTQQGMYWDKFRKELRLACECGAKNRG